MSGLDVWGRVVIVVGAVLGVGCGAGHVLLERAPADQTGSLGSLQRCAADVCSAAADQDESLFNESGTQRLLLPQCQFGIHRILVRNAGTADQVALVECAAADPSDPR